MWNATVKGIVGRRVRLALTTLAVVLGVAFVSGTFTLTDTLNHSFQGVFSQTLAGVDLVVRRTVPFGGGGTPDRQRFPATEVAPARAVPGVSAANGFVDGYAQFVDRAGHAIQNTGAPTIGIAWAQTGSHGPLRLVSDGPRRSRAPSRAGEVAMDVGTAHRHGFRVGDHVDVLLQGPKQRFVIVGLFGVGDRRDLGAVTFAAFDLGTAQQVFAAPGQLDAINVTAAPNAGLDALRTRLQVALGPGFEVSPAAQVARDRGQVVLNFLDLLTRLLLGFAAIGMVVAAFIIFNTFTILVTQRTRELGLLRAMGASGTQVVISVLAEAAAIGLAGAAAGLGAGYGLAALLLSLASRFGLEVPSQPVTLEGRTLIAALLVGVGATVVSSLWPALRAARTPPIAATTEVGPTRARPLRRRVLLGATALAASVPLLLIGLDRTQYQSDVLREIGWVALGALLVLVGVLLVLAAAVRPLVATLARPLRAPRIPGVLARANAARNPRRTAATASALVIGLALVGLVATFGDSAKTSVRRAVAQGIRADVVLKAQQFATFSPEVGQRVARLSAVAAVTAFRFGYARVPVGGNAEAVAGADPEHLAQVVNLRLRHGGIGAMGDDGVLVAADSSRQYGLAVGDRVDMQFQQGTASLRVAGVYDQRDFTGGFPVGFVVTQRAFEQGFGTKVLDTLVYVRAKPGEAGVAAATVRRTLASSFPNINVFTRHQYQADQERAINRFLAVTVALLMLSEIIAVLGIVNTLALSVFERTHELGLLRVVGMSRRQLRRMIREESVIVATIGGLVGTGLGLFWGWIFAFALRPQGVTVISFPVVQLVVFVAISMLAGVVAALTPAWRAAHLDALEAIAAE
jgi:putative ABC transport system permease protein